MESLLPSARFKAVTASDTAAQFYTCASVAGAEKSPLVIRSFRYLYIGGAGDVTLKNDAGASIAFQNVPAGSILIANASYVMAATTATNIMAFY